MKHYTAEEIKEALITLDAAQEGCPSGLSSEMLDVLAVYASLLNKHGPCQFAEMAATLEIDITGMEPEEAAIHILTTTKGKQT